MTTSNKSNGASDAPNAETQKNEDNTNLQPQSEAFNVGVFLDSISIFCNTSTPTLSEERKKELVNMSKYDVVAAFVEGKITSAEFEHYKGNKKQHDIGSYIEYFVNALNKKTGFHWGSKEADEIKKLLKDGHQMPTKIIDTILENKHNDTKATYLESKHVKELMFFLAFHSDTDLDISYDETPGEDYEENSDARNLAICFAKSKLEIKEENFAKIHQAIINHELSINLVTLLSSGEYQKELNSATDNWQVLKDVLSFWSDNGACAQSRFQALRIIKSAAEILDSDQKEAINCRIDTLTTHQIGRAHV